MNCPANRLALIIRAEHGSTDHRRRSLYSTNWQHSCLQSESLVPFYGDVAEPLISSRRRRARSQVSFAGCEGSSVAPTAHLQAAPAPGLLPARSEEHKSELKSLMSRSYAVMCLN